MKIKKKRLKNIILILILTLSLLIIPFFTNLKVSAATTENVTININDNLEVQEVEDLSFDRLYYDIIFTNNQYGLVGRGTVENAYFWGDVMASWRAEYPTILVGCELIISLRTQGRDNIFTYTIGFTYSTDSGLINQYVGNDAAVLLGSQLCNARTGLKTYNTLKEDPIYYFEIAAIELYMRTEELDAAYGPNPIKYYYKNPSANTFDEDAEYIMSSLSKGRMYGNALAFNGSSKEIYDKGISEGYEDGYDVGTTDGKKQGYEVGYSTGKIDGYEEGYTASGYGIDTMTGSVLASFFSAFWTIASFEIFGIQLWTIPAIIGGVGLIWIVIKFFLGKGD